MSNSLTQSHSLKMLERCKQSVLFIHLQDGLEVLNKPKILGNKIQKQSQTGPFVFHKIDCLKPNPVNVNLNHEKEIQQNCKQKSLSKSSQKCSKSKLSGLHPRIYLPVEAAYFCLSSSVSLFLNSSLNRFLLLCQLCGIPTMIEKTL